MPKVTINGTQVKAKSGTTILNAANSIGIDIPTLCFLKEMNEIGFCRICVVEVEGEQDLVSACNTEIKNGMVIETDSDTVLESRASTLALLASKHRFDCWRCPKDGNCEFYDLLRAYDVAFTKFGPSTGRYPEIILGTGISQDQTKCVLCKRCVAVCANVTTTKVLKFRDDEGIKPVVSPTPGLSFDEAGCISCGQCVNACPTGTLFETDAITPVEAFLRDRSKTTVVQVSPESVASLGEEFGLPIGTPVEEVEGKLYSALNKIGFNEVTDTVWGEGIVVEEVANELVTNVQNNTNLPLFTSTCPAWVNYCEMYQPSYLENLSKVKSPHVTQGAIIKNIYAPKQLDVKPEDVVVVSVMPCTANKSEIVRKELTVNGIAEVDAVLTVRELAKLIRKKGIDFKRLEPSTLDTKLATFTSAFNNTSDVVLEEVIRLANQKLGGEPIFDIKYKVTYGEEPQGYEGMIKEATIKVANHKLNIAQINGGAAIKEFFIRQENSKKQYHLVQVMACPNACVNGGGQPIHQNIDLKELVALRNQAKKSQTDEHVNVAGEILNDLLGGVNSETSQKYLHTTYSQKEFTKE